MAGLRRETAIAAVSVASEAGRTTSDWWCCLVDPVDEPLLGLHGHIHESRGAVRIGRTLAINPGSSYEEGALQGALVTLDTKKAKIKTTCWSTDRTGRNSRHS